jgi:hypothetical protein
MPRAMRGVVEQHVLRQPHQPLARAVVAAVAISLQDSGALQLRKHAVHGRLGQPVSSTMVCKVKGWLFCATASSSANKRRLGVSPSRRAEGVSSLCFISLSIILISIFRVNLFHKKKFICTKTKKCHRLTSLFLFRNHRFQIFKETEMAATDNRKVVEGVHKMTPSEAFVETCVANGVSEMFGIMGSAFMDAMDIFAPAGIRLIPVVHEQGAAHMADGYARVSGRHGVVIGQNGPGISNCVTGIAAAYWAHSPVVIVTPETGTMGMGLGGFQEANQLPMFQEFTKYQGHVCNPKRMAEFTGRVFDRAMSEMGPTQLNIPRDYFYGEIECEIPSPCAWTAAMAARPACRPPWSCSRPPSSR